MMTRVRRDQIQARVNGNPMFVFSNDTDEDIVDDIAGFICLLPESKMKIWAIQGKSNSGHFLLRLMEERLQSGNILLMEEGKGIRQYYLKLQL